MTFYQSARGFVRKILFSEIFLISEMGQTTTIEGWYSQSNSYNQIKLQHAQGCKLGLTVGSDGGEHVSAAAGLAEGDVVNLFVVSDQLRLHVPGNEVGPAQHLTRFEAPKMSTARPFKVCLKS